MVCWRRTILNIATAVMLRDLIEEAVKNGAQGVVVAGVGDANITPPALNELTKAAKNGIAVARSPRVAQGIALRNNEVDDKLGFRRLWRAQSSEVARAIAPCSHEDHGSAAHPEDVRGLLRSWTVRYPEPYACYWSAAAAAVSYL
jgi:hypothetical protein